MRLAERKEGKYLPFDVQMLPTDNMEQIYVTHDPAAESLDSVRFDIRSPHTCHMSSVAYLERTLEFMILARPPKPPPFPSNEPGQSGKQKVNFSDKGKCDSACYSNKQPWIFVAKRYETLHDDFQRRNRY